MTCGSDFIGKFFFVQWMKPNRLSCSCGFHVGMTGIRRAYTPVDAKKKGLELEEFLVSDVSCQFYAGHIYPSCEKILHVTGNRLLQFSALCFFRFGICVYITFSSYQNTLTRPPTRQSILIVKHVLFFYVGVFLYDAKDVGQI